jgi:transcriptional regulator with PAS, ATPase and Fis domain
MTKKKTVSTNSSQPQPNKPIENEVKASGIERKVHTANEIKKRLKANNWLIDGAAPFINKMFTLMNEQDIVLVLTDTEGCIMHIVSSEHISKSLSAKYIIPGSYPPQNSIILNTIEDAIKFHKEAQADGTETLVKEKPEKRISWTCPLVLLANHMVGTLTMYFPKEIESKTLFALFSQTSNCIKQELSFFEEKRQATKLKEQQLNFFNRYAQAELIVDRNGYINLASNEACTLFGVEKTNIERKKITQFIPNWDAISHHDSKWVEVENREVFLTNVENSGFYLLNSKAVMRTQNKFDEQICTFRSMRQVLNEANKYIGNTAYVYFEDIIGASVPMKRMTKEAKSIAKTELPVMLLGEKYTGRETLAQAIHNHSKRTNFGFVRVDVSALSTDQLEETLWGYTENHKPHLRRMPKPGAFEFANGGTLYINEIGLLPKPIQDKVFDVIKTQKVGRLGSTRQTTIDVRIICSSSFDLTQKIEANEFRIDLFYTLSTASLRVPPLRERRADIPMLMGNYMAIKSRELGIKAVEIPKKIILILKRYEWPENFKEMIELTERIILDKGQMFKTFKNERDFKKRNLYLEQLKEVESIISIDEHEKELIIRAYNAFNGSISKASRRLGISRNTLYLKLKKYGIDA